MYSAAARKERKFVIARDIAYAISIAAITTMIVTGIVTGFTVDADKTFAQSQPVATAAFITFFISFGAASILRTKTGDE